MLSENDVKFGCFTPLQDKIKGRLLYIGSKASIAPAIVNKIYELQPRAKYAFDLFGGGGAMSFAFAASNLQTYYNEIRSDICSILTYCFECIKSPKSDFSFFSAELFKFVSRKEFKDILEKKKRGENITPQDAIKSQVYSFYAMGKTYFKISKNVYPVYCAHYLILAPFLNKNEEYYAELLARWFYNSYNRDENVYQVVKRVLYDFTRYKTSGEWIDRCFVMRQILARLSIISNLNTFRKYKNCNLTTFLKIPLKELGSKSLVGAAKHIPQHLEPLQNLQHLQDLQYLQNLDYLQIINKSYCDFDFTQIIKDLKCLKDEIIIYCDPPYLSSPEMNLKSYKNIFNYAQFMEWVGMCVKNGFKVFLSELNNPDESLFKEVLSIQKYKKVGKNKLIYEKLFLAE